MRLARMRLLFVAVAAAAAAVAGSTGMAAAGGAGRLAPGPVVPAPVVPAPVVPAPVAGGPAPQAGTHALSFCGSYWKNVISRGVGYNIYNDDFGASTCLGNDGNVGFAISRSTAHSGLYQAFPNISSGWQWGTEPLHDYTFPVQERNDGHPVSSVSVRLVNSGTYDAAYDMWFSTYRQTNGQDNAAEVMIWLDCRGNCLGGPEVRIEGVLFHKATWITHHNGTSWRYTAFVAVTHRSYFSNLWLNPFYQAAGVNPGWYLTSVDFGFELMNGGAGLRVNSYSLTGMN